MNSIPPVIPFGLIAKWLPEIFPEGTASRTYVIREMAAKTIFVMLYAGAVEGLDRWLRPDQITKMTDRQAGKTDDAAREAWLRQSLRPGGMRNVSNRWYAPNTREPIRDETLRAGLVALGAVIERGDLPTTSAKPRYALSRSFAGLLLQLHVAPNTAASLIQTWQADHLATAALSRIRLLRQGTVRSGAHKRVVVTFPNGQTRLMLPGPSTEITKAVLEVFAPHFLHEPGVVFVSESGNKVVQTDAALAAAIGLQLDYARNLPDIILVDISAHAAKIVFVEVVATDGAVTEPRKRALLDVAAQAGYGVHNVYFVSAFRDRGAPAFRKLVSELAWDTHAWFVSEPDKLVLFRGEGATELCVLVPPEQT